MYKYNKYNKYNKYRKYNRYNRYNKYKKNKTQTIIGKKDKEIHTSVGPINDSVIYKGIGIPSKFFTKIKYHTTVTLNTSSLNDIIIRGNSINDPEYALGGGRPMYVEQFAQLYDRYVVYASNIDLAFTNTSGTGGSAFAKVGVFPLSSPVPVNSTIEAIERDNCTWAQLGPNTGDQGILNMSMYAKSTAVLGLPNNEGDDDVISAPINSNPTREAFWHVFAGTNDIATNTNIYVDITVVYYVKFYEKKQVARS